MRKTQLAFPLALLVTMLTASSAFADLSSYSQDFDGLVQTDSAALTDDGWLVFANVFTPGGAYLYGYGPFGAPNGTPGFSGITNGDAGTAVTNQHIVSYSDYNNTGEHTAGNIIEANVFQEQIIGAADVGKIYRFNFDAAVRDLVAPSTSLAFIKTLDPGAGFALTNFFTQDTTTLPSTSFTSFALDITIDPGLVGQILQFGFANNATNFDPSGVNYDNVQFSAIPEPASLSVLGLAAFGFLARRRRKA